MPGTDAVIALLGLSSCPSRIAGVGTQGRPVLSFHTPCAHTQQLAPVVWGTRPAPPPAHAADEPLPPERVGREKRPAASGRTLSAAQLDLREQLWLEDPLIHAHVPLPPDDARTAHLLCAAPARVGGGVLVFCEESILYVPPPAPPRTRAPPRARRASAQEKRRVPSDDGARDVPKRRKTPDGGARADDGAGEAPPLVHLRVPRRLTVAAAAVLDAGDGAAPARVVLSAADGAVYVLALHVAPGEAQVARLALHRVGASSSAAGPRALTPLGEGFVHVASALGDAVLLDVGGGDAVREVHRWPSLAPVLDMVVDEAEDAPHVPGAPPARVVTCSGAGASCSLRIFWHGVAAHELARVAVPACLGVRAITTGAPARTTHLALLFATHTRVLDVHGLVDVSAPMAERGAPLGVRALHVQGVCAAEPTWIVVTPHAVAAVARTTAVWTPAGAAAAEIVAADATDAGDVLVGLAGGRVVRLALRGGAWAEEAAHTLAAEVACVALPRAHAARVALVGTWALRVEALALADLAPAPAADVDALPALPVALAAHAYAPGAPTYVYAALASGDVRIAALRGASAHAAAPVHTLRVGARPAALAALAGDAGVVALGERAYVAVPDGGGERVRYSALRSAPLRGAAALVGHGACTLAAVEADALVFLALDTAHAHDVRTVDLGAEQPTSIAAYAPADAYAVTTWPALAAERGAGDVHGAVRLVARADLAPRATYALLRGERANCVAPVALHGTTYLAVGTGFVRADDETRAGRVLGFEVRGAALALAFALDVPGNVYGVAPVANVLAAAVNAQVVTYALDVAQRTLVPAARWGCAFVASSLVGVRGDAHTLVVGDAMRSLTVLAVADGGAITECARDLDPYWTVAVAACDAAAQHYLGADIAMNVFVAARVPTRGADHDDDYGHAMRRTAGFHYGDMVNRLVQGAGRGVPRVAAHLGTAAGALGALWHIDAELGALLDVVQHALAQEARVPGDIPWTEWRTLRTDHRTAPPRGVLDGELLGMLAACTPAQRERVVAVASHLARRKEHTAPPVSADAVLRALDRLAALP